MSKIQKMSQIPKMSKIQKCIQNYKMTIIQKGPKLKNEQN